MYSPERSEKYLGFAPHPSVDHHVGCHADSIRAMFCRWSGTWDKYLPVPLVGAVNNYSCFGIIQHNRKSRDSIRKVVFVHPSIRHRFSSVSCFKIANDLFGMPKHPYNRAILSFRETITI